MGDPSLYKFLDEVFEQDFDMRVTLVSTMWLWNSWCSLVLLEDLYSVVSFVFD